MVTLSSIGCSSPDRPADPVAGDDGSRWRPSVDDSWQWQLEGVIDLSHEVEVYDVDLFDTSSATMRALHAAGRRVVCYVSVGTWEPFRADAGVLPDEAIGASVDGFEEERWVDVRHPAVRDLVAQRFAAASERGCDGVEPDNVDGYDNDSGFPLSAEDQLEFNRFVAATAHNFGLAVGLKNDLDQVTELVGEFDFAVTEQCHELDECTRVSPFVTQGKPVFNAEYDAAFVSDPRAACSEALALGIHTLVLPIELDGGFRISCDVLE